ncbi:hypothetical protein AB205_0003660, partial [Aquarana catesbeiana]
CPRPLYSRDSTQEDHTIPHHHQRGNLRDCKIEVKEEIKEEDDEDGVMEESEYLKEHRDLYQDTMVGSSSYRNSSERCPHPLYSRDSTQEDHTIPHHHQSGTLEDDNIDVKEEYKEEDEEYGVMEEFSEGHKDKMKTPHTRNPPERCPRPLYSQDSTQEGHTIPHCYKSYSDPVRDNVSKCDPSLHNHLPLHDSVIPKDADKSIEFSIGHLSSQWPQPESSPRSQTYPLSRSLEPCLKTSSKSSEVTSPGLPLPLPVAKLPWMHSQANLSASPTVAMPGDCGDSIAIEFEVKAEKEERDDQQSMEEDGITGTFTEEDTPTEIST